MSTSFYLWKRFTLRFHCRLFYGCCLSSYLHPLPIKQGEVDVGLDRMNHLALGTWFFSKGASTSVRDAGTIVLGDSASHCLSCEVSASLSLVLTPQGDRGLLNNYGCTPGTRRAVQHPSWRNHFLVNLQ